MTIRVGLIGYGLAGRVFHGPLITADDHYRLDVVVSGNAERAELALHRHPGVRVVSTVDELLAQRDHLDLVVIAAPTPRHAELARLTIGRALPTVVDKPLAVHAGEAERLIDLAQERDTLLTVFHNRRWDGDFLTVKRLVDEGRLGEVHRFESRFEWISSRPQPLWKTETSGAEGGGVAYDLGSHLIDQAIQLFGPVIESETYGELLTRRDDGVNDDDTFIALVHESGVRSHLGMSSLVAQRGFRFRVLGSASAYTKRGLDTQEEQLGSGVSPHDTQYGTASSELDGRLGSDLDHAVVPTERGRYPEFYRQLALAIEGRGPAPVDPRDAVAGIRIVERLRAAADAGR